MPRSRTVHPSWQFGIPFFMVFVVGPAGLPQGECGAGPTSISLRDRARHPAVSNFEYQVLFEPGCGCSGMTQFVGYVPAVCTPRHVHLYCEMLCIVRGNGIVEIDGQESKFAAGWCYYLPEGTPHLVQNRIRELPGRARRVHTGG